MALLTLSGSSIMMLLMLLFASSAAQRSTKEDHIVIPTTANEKIETQGKGDCTIEIKIATGDKGTDGEVGVRVYDGQSSFLDFPSLDNPGVDDFEALHIDTFTFQNQPCFKNVCAAKVRYSSSSPWSFESAGVKVKDSNGAVVSESFGVYGKALTSNSIVYPYLDNVAIVGSCA